MSIKEITERSHQLLHDWITSCTRANKISRNTIAVGIVVLDHMSMKSSINPHDVISAGGEIVGSRSQLHPVLRKYGVQQPEKFLKEVTTRQAHPDGKRLFEIFIYGAIFDGLTDQERKNLIDELIQVLIAEINQWFERQNLKLSINRQDSPVSWITQILEEAKSRSGGVVEQHLVGAKLQSRHPHIIIPNFPGHAADVQTGRAGDFVVGTTVYHVTASPTPHVIEKCRNNLNSGLHPVLLIPGDLISKTKSFAEYAGIQTRLTVISIEDFVALNIIEMASGVQKPYFEILDYIIETYNQRLEQVETDMSLKIDIH